MQWTKLAEKYGVSRDKILARWDDFIQNEGYIERGGDVTECATFGAYLQCCYALPKLTISEDEAAQIACEAGQISGAM